MANDSGTNGPRKKAKTGRNRNSLMNLRSKEKGALGRAKAAATTTKLPEVGSSPKPPMPGTERKEAKPFQSRPSVGSQATPAALPSGNTVGNLAAGTSALNQATTFLQGQAQSMAMLAQQAKKAGKGATFNRAAQVQGNLMYVPGQYEKWVKRAAQKYNLDPRLIAAVGQMESGWSGDVGITSSAGAQGPMQVMPFWQGEQPHNINKYKGNILAGANILRRYQDNTSGGWLRALAAYNAGPGNIPAGMDYARSVLALYKRAKG